MRLQVHCERVNKKSDAREPSTTHGGRQIIVSLDVSPYHDAIQSYLPVYWLAACQLGSGSYWIMDLAIFIVFTPRSFSYTIPSGPAIKVFTPEERYSAG